MRPHLPLSLLLAGLLLAGCGDDTSELEALREEVAARETSEADLVERLDALEDRLEEEGEDDPDVADRLEGLTERLDEMETTLAGLDDDVTAQQGARAELREELEAATADLRSTLADVQGEIDGLQGEVSELRTLYATLRERLDEQQRQG